MTFTRRLHTKLYQKLPFPVILVRRLRKINQVQLLCLDVEWNTSLDEAFFKESGKTAAVPLVLDYPAQRPAKPEAARLREAVEQAKGVLTESGCTVTVQDTLSSSPEQTRRDS